jgi:hypothetical protein
MGTQRVRSAIPWLLLLALAALPGDGARALLAAVAGTLFEAAPFVAVAAVVPRPFGRLVALAGCGCGRGGVPGALAPVAVGLCWVTFGPAVAIGRAFAGIAAGLAFRRFRAPTAHRDVHGDAFDELAAVAICAAVSYGLFAMFPAVAATAPGSLAFGLIAGVVAPCATAGIALASASAPHAPLAAAAILATSGIVPHIRIRRPKPATGNSRDVGDHRGRFAMLAIAAALGIIAWSGPKGLVHPRLLPLDALGAVAALALGFRGTRSARPARAIAIAASMLAALALGSPQPQVTSAEATLADGYAGEPARFTGVAYAERGSAGTRLVRFAITCCRIDAHAIALPLDRRLHVRDGTWIAARGILRRSDGTLVLRPSEWHTIVQPSDPFTYQ